MAELGFGYGDTSYGDGLQFNYLTGQYEYGIPKQQQTVHLGGGGTTISDFGTGDPLATGYYNDGVFEQTADYSGGGLPRTGTSVLPVQINGVYYDPADLTTPIGTNWVDAEQYMMDKSSSYGGSALRSTDNMYDTGGGLGFGSESPDMYGGSALRSTDNMYDTGGGLDFGSESPDMYGGGGGQGPADTSWDWAQFTPLADRGWGAYDQDYGAYERYVPGQESPWGNPNYPGGNQEFYQQQFANLLRGEQDFRSAQQASQEQAAAAAQDPYQSLPTDWSWAHGGEGLPTVWEAGPSTPRQLHDQFSGMTNQQVIDALGSRGAIEAPQIDWLTRAATNAGSLDKVGWASGNYDANYNNTVNSSLAPDNKQILYQVYNALYSQPQAPQAPSGVTVPTGYASPVNF